MTTLTRLIRSDLIDDPKSPMRSVLDNETLFELAESIKREGLINPITVRPVHPDFQCISILGTPTVPASFTCGHWRYEVVAGHRRFAACKIAGKVEIECVVRELSDDQAFEIMAHENLERQDVDPVDEALFIGRLIGENENKIKEVADKLGRSVQWVEDRLDILTYPEYLVQALRAGSIKLGVAKHLGAIDDDSYRYAFVQSALNNNMSVLQAEHLYRQWKGGVFKSSSEIMVSDIDVPVGERPRARATCARCGKVAIDPNLENVFIHMECPDE